MLPSTWNVRPRSWILLLVGFSVNSGWCMGQYRAPAGDGDREDDTRPSVSGQHYLCYLEVTYTSAHSSCAPTNHRGHPNLRGAGQWHPVGAASEGHNQDSWPQHSWLRSAASSSMTPWHHSQLCCLSVSYYTHFLIQIYVFTQVSFFLCWICYVCH